MSDVRRRLLAQETRIPGLSEDLRALDRLFDTDVQSALNKVRLIAEKVLHRLCTARGVSWGNAEPTLGRMLGPLISSGVIPKDVAVHVQTVQANANFGSHFQQTAPSPAHLAIAASGLAEFLAWYETLPGVAASNPPGRPASQALRILVVEEEVLNRRIAEALLRKQGHVVTLVGSGKDAVEAVTGSRFDLILMQVQMEGMDGFEAVDRIGALEGQRGRYTPVIGMTSDSACRARAQARGMVGSMSRPVNHSELLEAIQHLGAIDWPGIFARVGGDRSLVVQLAANFLDEYPPLLEKVREALTRQDTYQLLRAANTMRGEATFIGASAARAAALRLEQIARSNDLSDAGDAYAALVRGLDLAKASVLRFLNGSRG